MMHLARLIFFTLLVIVVLFSCGNPTENKIEEHIPSIGDVTWLEGVWQDTSNKNQFELWSRAGSELLGNGIYVRKGDTSYFEQLRIAELENGLIYEATVKEDQGPVRFLITYLGDSNMVFENPSHLLVLINIWDSARIALTFF